MQNLTTKIVNIDQDEITEIKAIEHDTQTRFINFRFISNNSIVDLTDCNVRIYARTANYTEIFNPLKIIDAKRGIAQLELTDNLLCVGENLYQLKIMPVSGGQLSSNPMRFIVKENLMRNFDPSSSNEYKVFELALQEMDQYDKRLKDLETSAKQYDDRYLPKKLGSDKESYKFEQQHIEVGENSNDSVYVGVGSSDVYMKNNKSGKYFQLKDDGRVMYDNVELLREISSNALWTGYHHMTADESITIKPISEMNNGIVLVWSHFTSGNPDNWDISYSYIPKNSPLLNSKHTFALSSGELDTSLCSKTIYISNGNKISGHDNNKKSGSNSASVVLRAILEY